MKALKLVLAVSCIYLAACSKSSKGDGIKIYNFDDQSTAQEVFKTSTIDCDAHNCPEAAGGLTTYTDSGYMYEVGVCTTTLISKDTAITNKHCIPDGLQYKGANCMGRMMVKFPATGNKPAESIECAHVKDFSAESTVGSADHPDWAVIQLKSSSTRTPIDVDINGIENRKDVHLFPVFYTLDKNASVIRVSGDMRLTTCKTNQRTEMGTHFFHKFSALFAISECNEKIIHGNSGSGLISQEGKLIGVGSYGPDEATAIDAHQFGGTNLACLKQFNSQPSVFCTYEEKNAELFFEGLWLRLFNILNTENYFEVSTTSQITVPLLSKIRSGSGGVQLMEFSNMSEGDTTFSKAPEVQSYLHEQLTGFAFKNSGQCIEQGSADQFDEQMVVNSIDYTKAYLRYYHRPVVANESLVKVNFKRVDNQYVGKIQAQTVTSTAAEAINKLSDAEDSCLLTNNYFTSTGTETCYSVSRLSSDMTYTTELSDQSLAINTNLFLERMDAKDIQVSIPVCP
jgi:hypothetical protein